MIVYSVICIRIIVDIHDFRCRFGIKINLHTKTLFSDFVKDFQKKLSLYPRIYKYKIKFVFILRILNILNT